MGFLADDAVAPLGPIALRGLACAELDCLGALVLGDWADLAPHVGGLVARDFDDPARGELHDLLAGLLREHPALTVADRLQAVPEHLVEAISVVLRWSDRPGFEPTGGVLRAAYAALDAAPSIPEPRR